MASSFNRADCIGPIGRARLWVEPCGAKGRVRIVVVTASAAPQSIQ
jgi:hypothetical protein